MDSVRQTEILREDDYMCKFCGKEDCKITKQMVLERGPILESNARSIMRDLSDTDEGVDYTYSFDEDTGCDGDWESQYVQNPLDWKTEKDFLDKFNKEKH